MDFGGSQNVKCSVRRGIVKSGSVRFPRPRLLLNNLNQQLKSRKNWSGWFWEKEREYPDRTFHNFGAPESAERRFRTTQTSRF